jgi:hypothetical protein
MLDAATSDIPGLLWRDICVSSTQVNSPIWEEAELISTLQHLTSRRTPFKNCQLKQGNTVLDSPDSNMDGFLLTDTCVS